MPSPKSTVRLAQFHDLAGHAGPAAGCEVCARQQRSQRRAASAFRPQQRQAHRHADTILRKAAR